MIKKTIIGAFAACGILAFSTVFGLSDSIDYSQEISKMSQKEQDKLTKKAGKEGTTAAALLKAKMEKKSRKTGISIGDLFRRDEIKRKEKAGESLSRDDEEFLLKYRMKKWGMSKGDVEKFVELKNKKKKGKLSKKEEKEYENLQATKKRNKKNVKNRSGQNMNMKENDVTKGSQSMQNEVDKIDYDGEDED